MMSVDKNQFGKSDAITRIFHMLETIGRAHLHGGLDIADTLPFFQQIEVGAILDHLAEFAAKIDIGRQERHERPE